MSEAVGRSTAVMAAGTATSRVLGVVRSSLLVAAIGLNVGVANAFALANWLPNMLYMLIAGGVLNAVLVPQVVKAYRSDAGQEFVDRLLTLSAVILLALTVTLTVSAPLIVRIASGATDPATTALTVSFALWCLPQIFFYGLYTLLGQVLNARGSFGPYMWAPVVNNIVAIAGLGVFLAVHGRVTADGSGDLANWDAGRIALLAAPATLGVITQALVLFIPLWRSGVRLRPRRGWRGTGLGTAGRVAGWTFAALLVGQAGILAVQRVANSAGAVADAADLVAGEVAGNNAYGMAFTIFMLPHSLVTVSLLTALFTGLAARATAGDTVAVRTTFSRGVRVIGVFTAIATALLAVLAVPVARVVMPTASAAEIGSMAPLVVALALGLGALGAWSLCQRVFYAYEDARGLFRIQVAMAAVVTLTAVLGWRLAPVEWWTAIACAGISASYLLGAVWAGIEVRARVGGTGRRVVRLFVRATVAAVGSALVGWSLLRVFGDVTRLAFATAFLGCVLVGTVMVVAYVVLLRLMHVTELQEIVGPLTSRFAPVSARLRRSMTGRTDNARSDRTGHHGGDLLDDVVIGHGTVLSGRYRLLAPTPGDLEGVAHWTAHDEVLDRPVRALVLRSAKASEAQDAARRAALVLDPRLARVLEVGTSGRIPYVVTEPIEGRTLGEMVARSPLPADQARAIIGEAAAALEVARRRGVHHLALRPSAVRITPSGQVLVTGLGLEGALVHTGPVDARSTTRADAVGLVALLYLCLTGRWPAPEDGLPAAGTPLAPVVAGGPVPPTELSPGVPNDLDTLCAVTLGPHDDGPQSPAELVRDLEPWGSVVPPDHVWQGLWDSPDDARGVASVAAGAGVVAAGATTGATAGGATLPAGPSPRAVTVPIEDEPGAGPDEEMAAEEAGDVEPTGSEDLTDESGGGSEEPEDRGRSEEQDPEAGGSEEVEEPEDAEDDAEALAPEPPDATSEFVIDFDEEFEAPEVAPAVPVARLSVADTLTRTVGAPPGTPPPARPDRAVAGDPAREATRGERPAVVPPVLPARPGPAPDTGPRPPFAATPVPAAPDRPRRRVDLGMIVLLAVLVALAFGIYVAFQALTRPLPPIGGTGGMPEWTAEDTTDAPTPTTTEPAPEPTTTSPVVPTIASARQIDPPPDGDENEHPELVDLAIDGDPATVWYSRTYARADYGMKTGIGFAVTLAEPATVTTVTLDVRGTGGNVEIRMTDPTTPTEGEVLASGPVGPGTVFTLAAPTEGQHVVAWFTGLPQTADGSNRIELATFAVE